MMFIMKIIEQRIFCNKKLRYLQNVDDSNSQQHFVEFVSIHVKFTNAKNRAISHFMHSNTDVFDEMMLMNEIFLKKTRYKIENDDQFVNNKNDMSTNNENENDDEKNDDESNEKKLC